MHNRRKQEHLDICLTEDVRSGVTTGLERYRFRHRALPEIALADVSSSSVFLGRPLGAPLLLSAMTGGTAPAALINRHLASAAQEFGLAMGLGSQRTAIEDPALMDTYHVRALAPDVPLYANLGAVQLNYGYGVEECRRAVEGIGADALVLHLNPLHEALQPGGNTDFRGLLDRIAEVCRRLSVPVIVKEVGWGLSPEVARDLAGVGVAAVDVAGAGGTSWSEVERLRNPGTAESRVAPAFAHWGIPTAEALVDVRAACPDLPLIASGGVCDGVEAGICLALGAQLVGIAIAVLRPATESEEAVIERVGAIVRQLRTAMFCVGARTVADLGPQHLSVRGQ